jgi:hypothetical protein
LATVSDFQRQIGLLEGLEVKFFDAAGHDLGPNEELGLEWPYVRRTRGRVTVGEWRRSRITPLRPKLKVWVISGSGHRVGKGATLKKVRASWPPGHFEHLVGHGRFEPEADSAVIVIGDRNRAAIPDLGDATVAEGPYGLAVAVVRPGRGRLQVWVDSEHPTGMHELVEVTIKIPSRVLRIQDTQGAWHTDIPCKRPRITVYGDRASAPWAVLIVVDRRREQRKPDPPVDLGAHPRFRARERNLFEERLDTGPDGDTIRGTVRRWQRHDPVEDAAGP